MGDRVKSLMVPTTCRRVFTVPSNKRGYTTGESSQLIPLRILLRLVGLAPGKELRQTCSTAAETIVTVWHVGTVRWAGDGFSVALAGAVRNCTPVRGGDTA